MLGEHVDSIGDGVGRLRVEVSIPVSGVDKLAYGVSPSQEDVQSLVTEDVRIYPTTPLELSPPHSRPISDSPEV